jgi:hypothetical protein
VYKFPHLQAAAVVVVHPIRVFAEMLAELRLVGVVAFNKVTVHRVDKFPHQLAAAVEMLAEVRLVGVMAPLLHWVVVAKPHPSVN